MSFGSARGGRWPFIASRSHRSSITRPARFVTPLASRAASGERGKFEKSAQSIETSAAFVKEKKKKLAFNLRVAKPKRINVSPAKKKIIDSRKAARYAKQSATGRALKVPRASIAPKDF